MIYYLHLLSEKFIGFHVFLYVTFRAIAAAVTAFLLTLMFGNFVIRKLTALKLGQPLRGAAEVHRLADLHGVKQGTPTMGGALVIGAVFISSLIWARPDNRFVWLALFSLVYLGVLGFVDDYLKVTKKKSEGISGRIKLVFQLVLAAIITVLFLTHPLLEVQARSLYVPFVKAPIIANMGWFTFVFFALVIVGSSNAVNLTDGLDGLAIMPTVLVGSALGIFAYVAGHAVFSKYLGLPYIAGAGELTVFCGALAGAGLGFLWFNAYPAEVFMGDVGALALGAALGTIAVVVRQEIVLFIMGGVFVVETLSVMLQVIYFKATGGRRIFRMAPLHHHYELEGWKESQVVVRFWIITMMLVLFGLSTLKLR